MFKKIENFFLGLTFKGITPEYKKVVGNADIISVDLTMTQELSLDFNRTIMMWEFAKKVESNGKYRCSFRENDGTLRKPARIKSDYRGSFVLYVSKDGKLIASYEVEFFPSIDQVAILGERIHGDEKTYSRSMNIVEALGTISMDLEKQL